MHVKQSMFGVCSNHRQIIAFFHSIGRRECFFFLLRGRRSNYSNWLDWNSQPSLSLLCAIYSLLMQWRKSAKLAAAAAASIFNISCSAAPAARVYLLRQERESKFIYMQRLAICLMPVSICVHERFEHTMQNNRSTNADLTLSNCKKLTDSFALWKYIQISCNFKFS